MKTSDHPEVLRLRQCIWDIFRVLGGDTDGDATPAALVSDIVPLGLEIAESTRRDYDTTTKRVEQLEATNARLRAALEDIGQYKGEGGPGTPWQEIVRDIGAQARAALAKEATT